MLILFTAFHTLHIFYLGLTDFQNFPEPAAFFQDFVVVENAVIKFSQGKYVIWHTRMADDLGKKQIEYGSLNAYALTTAWR